MRGPSRGAPTRPPLAAFRWMYWNPYMWMYWNPMMWMYYPYMMVRYLSSSLPPPTLHAASPSHHPPPSAAVVVKCQHHVSHIGKEGASVEVRVETARERGNSSVETC